MCVCVCSVYIPSYLFRTIHLNAVIDDKRDQNSHVKMKFDLPFEIQQTHSTTFVNLISHLLQAHSNALHFPSSFNSSSYRCQCKLIESGSDSLDYLLAIVFIRCI